jgi:alpha-tubulin suppressor-like RCC1 family protein
MSKKFLTRQNNNISEYGIQVRDDNPSTLINNQPYYNKETKQLKLKTLSNSFVLAETQRALQLEVFSNILPNKDGDILTLDVADLTPSNKINRSTIFDGTLFAETNYTQSTQSISISIWIKFNSAITDQHIFSYPKNTVNSFNLRYSSTQFVLSKNTETAIYATPLDNQWHHLVAVYDETDGLRLYIDSNLVASGNSDGALAGSGLLSVGSTDGVSNFFKGSLANLQIWSKPLNQGESLLIYKGGYLQDLSFITDFNVSDIKANYGMGDGNKYELSLRNNNPGKIRVSIENSTKTPVIATFKDFIGFDIGIAAGNFGSFSLKADGRVFAWGSAILTPTLVLNESDFVAIAAGRDTLVQHSLALKADGRVFAWGSNSSGQLGDGTIVNKSTPVQVVNESDFVAVAAGGAHSLALKADGRVYAWGSNAVGELGDGTIVGKVVPTLVLNESDFVAIAAGNQHSLALKADGRVFAWGRNDFNIILEDENDLSYESVPTLVVNESDFVAIAAGNLYSLALKADGRVFAWGYNGSGQLGDDTLDSTLTPVQVVNESDFVAIAAGSDHSLALKADGRVYAWGGNFSNGRLGDGTTIGKSSPVLVVGQSDFMAIAAGFSHSLALKADGRVYAWGSGGAGRLGDGTLTNKSSPVQVLSDLLQPIFVDDTRDSINSTINTNDIVVKELGTQGKVCMISKSSFQKSSSVELLDETTNNNTLTFQQTPDYTLDLPATPILPITSVFNNTTYLITTLQQTFLYEFSFSAWIKFDPSDTTQQVFKVGNFELYVSGTSIVLKKGMIITGTATFDLSNPANQGWNHFVATWIYFGPATGQIFLFRNGVQIIGSTSLNDDGGFGNSISGTLYIGANIDDANFRFLGKIANVEIWSTQLTVANAASLYNAGYYTNPASIIVSGLTNHYLMGDGRFDVYDKIQDQQGSSDFEAVDGLIDFDKNDLP